MYVDIVVHNRVIPTFCRFMMAINLLYGSSEANGEIHQTEGVNGGEKGESLTESDE